MKKSARKRAIYVLAGCIAALALCIAGALALLRREPAAQDVHIPGTRGDIYATVQLPGKLARGGEMPLVVLCHGFTGNRAGDGHFAPLADDLAAQGIASVRLDFPGCGDSDEPFTAYTLHNMADDVESVITYMQTTYGTGRTALVGHSMGGRLASLYPQMKGGISALVLWSPANGAGLNGLEFLNIDDFSAVESLAAEAEANGTVSTWGVTLGAEFVTEMRNTDPNAALRESALPTLLTYSGNESILSDTTQAETIAAVESLPQGKVVLEPFAAGNHNYLSDDPATAARLDEDLRGVTVEFLVGCLK
ncbi:alpha/beta hydrolase [Gemmiger sp.]